MDSVTEPVSESEVTCVECGYNLTGAVIGRNCPECGTPVERALRVKPQGPPLPLLSYVAPVLVTIFLCVLPGIIAVVYTSKANTAAQLGNVADYESAKAHRNGWMIGPLVLLVLFWILSVVLS